MNFKKLAVTVLVLSLWACGEDEPKTKYSFLDQDAAGLIGNTAWVFGDGLSYNSTGDNTFYVYLHQTQLTNGISRRIDLRIDEENFVNGNFSVVNCGNM